MTWRFDYRPRGIDPATGRRRGNTAVTLGTPDARNAEAIGPEAARRAATRLKGVVAAGGDPAEARRQAVRQAMRERANTLGRLVDEYAELLPTRAKLRGGGALAPGSLAVELRALRKAIAEMEAAELPAAQLTPVMVRRMLAARGQQPSAASKRFGALSRFCDWLLDDERIGQNPCKQLGRASRPKPPPGRHDYLLPAQLGVLSRLPPHSIRSGGIFPGC